MWDQHFVAAGSYAELVTLDAGLLAPAPFSVDLVALVALLPDHVWRMMSCWPGAEGARMYDMG